MPRNTKQVVLGLPFFFAFFLWPFRSGSTQLAAGAWRALSAALIIGIARETANSRR
jgi:hypothetical protein